MTREQTRLVESVAPKLQECRDVLDKVMYFTEPITNAEHDRVRGIYDMICRVMDKL